MTDTFRPDVTAGKFDPKLFDPTGRQLLVNEIFYSLQGEGYHAGQATIFIRMAKCNLACKFCDTEFETYKVMGIDDIMDVVRTMHPPSGRAADLPMIDLTGGEPLLQNCGPLVELLQKEGYAVGVETSGSVWAEWVRELDWVTVSPKVPKARIPEPLLDLFRHEPWVGEIKWVVNAAWLAQFERDREAMYIHGPKNYLQPESLNQKWTQAASKLIMQYPHMYQLSLQTHKLAGNP